MFIWLVFGLSGIASKYAVIVLRGDNKPKIRHKLTNQRQAYVYFNIPTHYVPVSGEDTD
jgi:hypothetical protein